MLLVAIVTNDTMKNNKEKLHVIFYVFRVGVQKKYN